MHSSCVKGQPLPGGEAEITVWMRTLVAIVNVRVEMDVIFSFRTELLTTVWREREREREREKERERERECELSAIHKWYNYVKVLHVRVTTLT